MKSMINVGAEVTKESMESLADNICKLLKVGKETNAEQKTIRHAITRLSYASKVDGVTVNNCSLTNNVAKNDQGGEHF